MNIRLNEPRHQILIRESGHLKPTNGLRIGKGKGTLVSHDDLSLEGFRVPKTSCPSFAQTVAGNSFFHPQLLKRLGCHCQPKPCYSRAQGQMYCFSLPQGWCSSYYINSSPLIIVYIIRWTTWLN